MATVSLSAPPNLPSWNGVPAGHESLWTERRYFCW